MTRTQVGLIDWYVPGAGWTMNTPMEPLGATEKRIRYELPGDSMISLGLARPINGSMERFYTDPRRADLMFQKGDLAETYQPQQIVQLARRDLEYWLFIVT